MNNEPYIIYELFPIDTRRRRKRREKEKRKRRGGKGQ